MKEKNKKNLRIIFIANAPLSSKKISIYQTLCQAQSLGKECKLFLLIPNRYDFLIQGKDIYPYANSILGIEKKINFKIKTINYLDLFKYKWINHHLRFAISNFMFAYSAIKNALTHENDLIYTRDFYTMIILSTLRKTCLLVILIPIFQMKSLKIKICLLKLKKRNIQFQFY